MAFNKTFWHLEKICLFVLCQKPDEKIDAAPARYRSSHLNSDSANEHKSAWKKSISKRSAAARRGDGPLQTLVCPLQQRGKRYENVFDLVILSAEGGRNRVFELVHLSEGSGGTTDMFWFYFFTFFE